MMAFMNIKMKYVSLVIIAVKYVKGRNIIAVNLVTLILHDS